MTLTEYKKSNQSLNLMRFSLPHKAHFVGFDDETPYIERVVKGLSIIHKEIFSADGI